MSGILSYWIILSKKGLPFILIGDSPYNILHLLKIYFICISGNRIDPKNIFRSNKRSPINHWNDATKQWIYSDPPLVTRYPLRSDLVRLRFLYMIIIYSTDMFFYFYFFSYLYKHAYISRRYPNIWNWYLCVRHENFYEVADGLEWLTGCEVGFVLLIKFTNVYGFLSTQLILYVEIRTTGFSIPPPFSVDGTYFRSV